MFRPIEVCNILNVFPKKINKNIVYFRTSWLVFAVPTMDATQQAHQLCTARPSTGDSMDYFEHGQQSAFVH